MKKLLVLLILIFGCTHPDTPEKPDEEVVSEQNGTSESVDTGDSDSELPSG